MKTDNTNIKIVNNHVFQHVTAESITPYGDSNDHVIEVIAKNPSQKGKFAIGYYSGSDKPKPIISISSMVGCTMKCQFCGFGREKFGRMLSAEEMYEQVLLMLAQASKFSDIEKQHKISITKSGEPMLNASLIDGLRLIASHFNFSFKVASVAPDGEIARQNFQRLIQFARENPQPVQLLISLISTDEEYRQKITGGNVASCADIGLMLRDWKEKNPNGRKPNLNIILSENTPADPCELEKNIPPSLANVRLRPYVTTANGESVGLKEISNEKYEKIRQNFIRKGYHAPLWGVPSETERKNNISASSQFEKLVNP